MTIWISSRKRFLGVIGVAALSAACSGGADGPTGETSTDEGFINGDLLHSIAVGQSHVLEFYELFDGELAVRESQPLGSRGVLDDLHEWKSLSEVFRLAEPDGAVPVAILDAEERAASLEASRSLEERPVIAEEARAEVDGDVLRPEEASPTATRAITCSADLQANGWGAQAFISTQCNLACAPKDWVEFSRCDTNWGWATRTTSAADAILWRQQEGDWNVSGRIAAWSLGTNGRVVWMDHPLAPRSIETWTWPRNSSGQTHIFHGESPCGHLHTNNTRCN